MHRRSRETMHVQHDLYANHHNYPASFSDIMDPLHRNSPVSIIYLPLSSSSTMTSTKMKHVPVLLVTLPGGPDTSKIKATDVIVAHDYYYDHSSLSDPHCSHNWHYEEPPEHKFAERNEEYCITVN